MLFRSALIILLAAFSLAADAPKGIVVDKEKKTISIPAVIAPRKLPNLTEIYPIEVIATFSHEKKGVKAHETVVNFDVKPSEVHAALEGLGLKAGTPAVGEGAKAEGPEVAVFIELPATGGGEAKRIPMERTLLDKKTGKPLKGIKWYFTGSKMSQPDPTKDDKVYGADLTGTLIGLFPVTNEVVIQTNLTMKDEPLLKLETDKKLLPAEGSPVRVIITVVPAK